VALTHLIDTSVLTRLRAAEVREAVEPLATSGLIGRTNMSDLEIGYSARNASEWDQLIRALEVFPLVEIGVKHFARARQVQRVLASRSQRGRKVPDLLIAAAAEDLRLTVVHYDADFDQIARATGQPCAWVVPAGTVS
jgi:predicted nucleic acid-binding protein